MQSFQHTVTTDFYILPSRHCAADHEHHLVVSESIKRLLKEASNGFSVKNVCVFVSHL